MKLTITLLLTSLAAVAQQSDPCSQPGVACQSTTGVVDSAKKPKSKNRKLPLQSTTGVVDSAKKRPNLPAKAPASPMHRRR